MTNFNQTPFLPSQLNFPTERLLAIVLDKMYIDIASRVNDRTIGIFSTSSPIIIGDAWYVSTVQSRQIAQRQVYQIAGAGSYAHGIDTTKIGTFTRIYGTFYDGTNWYGLPHVSAVAVINQISVQVTPSDIVIVAGAGAPAIVSGFIVLEWISRQ